MDSSVFIILHAYDPHLRNNSFIHTHSHIYIYTQQEYLEYRRQKWAAGVIAISWIMSVKLSRVRQQLKQTRTEHLEHFKIRSKEFARNWSSIKKSRRVVIHCPSLGYNQTVRSTIDLYNVRQVCLLVVVVVVACC